MGIINVEFYRLESSQIIDFSFENCMTQLWDVQPSQRIKNIYGKPTWLVEASINNDFIEGDFIRLKMDDIPVKGSLRGITERIRLGEDEGIGVQSAFLYNIPRKILLLERKQGGMFNSTLAKYILDVINNDNDRSNRKIFFDPIIQSETLRNLNSMRDIRKFNIRIATIDDFSIFADDDPAITEVTELKEYFQAPSLSLEISVGHHKAHPLSKDNILTTARNLLRRNGQEKSPVKSLRVSGMDENEELREIDLLKDRMREKIEHDHLDRTLTYEQRKLALKRAWEIRNEELNRIYPV